MNRLHWGTMVLMWLPLQGALKNRICFFFVIFLCLNYLFDQIFNNSKISSFFFKYSQRGVTSKGVKENMYGLYGWSDHRGPAAWKNTPDFNNEITFKKAMWNFLWVKLKYIWFSRRTGLCWHWWSVKLTETLMKITFFFFFFNPSPSLTFTS